MIKTAIGAQRYNNKMNQIFEDAKILKKVYLHDELIQALEIADRWFEKLMNDADFTPLAINDPLKPLLQQAKDKIEQALKQANAI